MHNAGEVGLIEPKTINVDGREYIISKFPAVAGRRIVTQYGVSMIPKIGEYDTNEAMMLMMLSYVSVQINDVQIRLNNQVLIDNHIKSFASLMKIEAAMMEYNCDFFQGGRILNFFEGLEQMLPRWTAKMLTALSQQLSQMEKPPSKNSKRSTR